MWSEKPGAAQRPPALCKNRGRQENEKGFETKRTRGNENVGKERQTNRGNEKKAGPKAII